VPGFQTGYPIVAALDLLGRRWILRILWELRAGPMGFRALQALCDQMSPSLLSQRLTVLQTTGLIHHSEEGTYHLTDVGKPLLQALAPLQAWAEQWAKQLRAQDESERAEANQERSRLQMSSAPGSPPTFLSVAPRFVVQDLEQALTFYEQLGFQTTYHDEAFAIVERDGIDLHLNGSPDSPRRHGVCWIAVTNIEALYQQYLPTNAVQSPPEAKPWGLKEFFLRDPFGNLILFAESIPEADASSEQGG
jgi:DNA-binding HxlR family transcriptional regulator